MSDLNRRFFLQAIDPRYGCAALEAMFIVDDLSALRLVLGSRSDGDAELRWTYWLEAVDLAALNELFGVVLESEGREVTLERWHSNRAVPYLIHAKYELLLLLDGTNSECAAVRGHDNLAAIEKPQPA
jgi:hypothetical protein